MYYIKYLLRPILCITLIPMDNNEEPAKRRGRPPLAPEKRRTEKLQMRTTQEVVEKVRRVGNRAVEKAILAIKERK